MHAMDGVIKEEIVIFTIKGDSLFLGITLFKLDTQKRRGNFPLTTVETKLLIDFFSLLRWIWRLLSCPVHLMR